MRYYKYKAWIVEKIEDIEAGMAVPTIDMEAETHDTKRRKMPPTAKARPTGSVADIESSWGPKPPSEEPPKPKPPSGAPPKPPGKKRKDIKNTTNLEGTDGEEWMQSKIAEAADDWHDGAEAVDDWHGGAKDVDGWRDGGYDDWFDETHDAKEFGFPRSWQMALQQFNVDKAAQLQLALLRDHDWYAASDVVWKLTKKGSYDDELKNPSGFVNRCCTTAFKNVNW